MTENQKVPGRKRRLFTGCRAAIAEKQMKRGQRTKLDELVLHEPRFAQGQLFQQGTRLFDRRTGGPLRADTPLATRCPRLNAKNDAFAF
jgi:hypothetical protein